MQNTVPGTNIKFDGRGSMFAMFRPLIQATDGLTLGQVCKITGLEPHSIQNWVKRGFVSHPVGKKYRERQLARILLISSLKDCMKIESIGELMSMVNGNANDESDDIISEEQMYDYLCGIMSMSGEGTTSADLPELVDKVTESYSPPSAGAEQRLKNALTVMVYAYLSGIYKRKAEGVFDKMKEI